MEHLLYRSETWVYRKSRKEKNKGLEMWCNRRMQEISWTDRIIIEEVVERVLEKRLWKNIKKWRNEWMSYILSHGELLSVILEGMEKATEEDHDYNTWVKKWKTKNVNHSKNSRGRPATAKHGHFCKTIIRLKTTDEVRLEICKWWAFW